MHVAAALALSLAAAAGAEVEARWKIRTTAPFAVRGGTLAIELEPLDPAALWPATVAVRLEGGEEIRAELGVVVAAPNPLAPAWTSPPDPIEVITPEQFRALNPSASVGAISSASAGANPNAGGSERPSAGGGAASGAKPGPGRVAAPSATSGAVVVALAPMPTEFEGGVTIVGSTVRPRWIEPPAPGGGARTDVAGAAGANAAGAAIATSAAESAASTPTLRGDDLPDPDRPQEYWRRVLLAGVLHEPAPSSPFTGPARRFADHRAELWRAGLARIERASPAVAAALVELLTARVADPLRPQGSQWIAAWISVPAELDALLSVLLDPQRDTESCMRAALGWMESRTPLTFWLESDAGGSVMLAVANPLPEEVVVRCAWVEAPRDAPVAVLVPARTLVRQSIDRPAEQSSRPAPRARGEEAQPAPRWRSGLTLRLEWRGWKGRLPCGPGLFAVRPPGLAFASFVPDLTLASAQSRRLELPTTPWRTTASLRRLGPRWELFIECLRPQPSPDDRVEVEFRRGGTIVSRFTVDEPGAIRVSEGDTSGELVAHAKSHSDRWRVRLELPDAWIPGFVLGEWERVLEVSIARFPGGGHGRQSAGLAVPGWRPPAPIKADLAAWHDMPSTEQR